MLYLKIDSLPEGLEDVTKFPDLVAELLKRGYSDQDVRKVVGENLIRVFEKAEQVSNFSSFAITGLLRLNLFSDSVHRNPR